MICCLYVHINCMHCTLIKTLMNVKKHSKKGQKTIAHRNNWYYSLTCKECVRILLRAYSGCRTTQPFSYTWCLHAISNEYQLLHLANIFCCFLQKKIIILQTYFDLCNLYFCEMYRKEKENTHSSLLHNILNIKVCCTVQDLVYIMLHLPGTKIYK